MKYQIDYGVHEALDLISIALVAPHHEAAVWVEPRVLSQGGLDAWDLGVTPTPVLIEAKLSPTRQDVLEWIMRARASAIQNENTHFHLVYSRGGGRMFAGLLQLVRLAQEASSSQEHFALLLEAEDVPCEDELMGELGRDSLGLLLRMQLVQMPESILDRNISFRARCLSGASGGQHLRDFLFARISAAVPKRERVEIQKLISEIRAEGIELQAPTAQPSDLPLELFEMLVALQSCPVGVQPEVLAEAQGLTPIELELRLGPLMRAGVLTVVDGAFALTPGITSFTVATREAIGALSKVLRGLLAYMQRNGRTPKSRAQLPNAVALARICAAGRPDLVANLFRQLDKHIKDVGDKHLVLDLALLSIAAARKATPKTRAEAEGEAHALICGVSWVYQRTGRLSEAQQYAEKSLRIGEDIGWDRNTAFCKKCLGRLSRLEAEETQDLGQRGKLLDESVLLIQEAIDRFMRHPEYGPSHPEVGDCYSLLGRTHLVARQLHKADDAIRMAYKLIHDHNSKDYADLLILDGDVQSAKRNPNAAIALYDDALASMPQGLSEASEIYARGFFRRGVSREELGLKTGALADFRKAKEIWQGLGEDEAAAQAEWREIQLSSPIGLELVKRLSKEGFRVKVKVARMHERRLASSPRSGPRRGEPSAEYWDSLIREATRVAAIEKREW